MKNIEVINELIFQLRSLPGVSQKQAENICNYLINTNEDKIYELVNSITNLKKNITFCKQCNNISFSELCDICVNKDRNQKQLCIVSSSDDVYKIEETNTYSGLYFVLHQEINVKKKENIDRKTIMKFTNLLKKHTFDEIIIATNWTPNGEATAFFLKGIINDMFPKINIYRLAVGLPINSALNYADNETLSQAIKNKTKY